jgi:hypothetical protein
MLTARERITYYIQALNRLFAHGNSECNKFDNFEYPILTDLTDSNEYASGFVSPSDEPCHTCASIFRLDRIAATVDAFKENICRLMVSSMPLDRESSLALPPGPLIRESTAVALAAAIAAGSRTPKQQEDRE